MLGQIVQRRGQLSIETLEIGVGCACVGDDGIGIYGALWHGSNALWLQEEKEGEEELGCVLGAHVVGVGLGDMHTEVGG